MKNNVIKLLMFLKYGKINRLTTESE